MKKNLTEGQRLTDMPVRIPYNGTFELTVRCNLHCKMCLFRHDDSENPALMAKELTADQWIDMARQVAEAGTLNLLITGGEPMLRPDFCEIWEGIYRQGFILELYTNATLVTPKIMETLKKYPPHKIGVTLYGATPETYEKVCGSAEAFHRMMEGIHQLQSLPSVMEFRVTLIKDNFAESDLIDDLIMEEFHAKCGPKQSCPINKGVRGACADVESCRVSPELDMEVKAKRLVKSMQQIIGDRFKPQNLKIERKNNSLAVNNEQKMHPSFFGCMAGMEQYVITYDGKLLACQMIDAFFTDAWEKGFQKAWEEFPTKVSIPYEEGRCSTCAYTDTCQSCYGSRYAETGDFNGCSDYIYRTAKARKQYESYFGGIDDEKCKL